MSRRCRSARTRCSCARSRSASAAPTGRSLRASSASRPTGDDSLVLGHELLGIVERDGHGFTRGDLVTATVRRSCSHCLACAEGAPDSCLTGDYSERGITRLHGFARELVAEDPAQLIGIPASLGRLGVLVEPTSICERGLRHARAIGGRQPWQLQRALVIGAGAIGMLSTYLLRLAGLDVWTAGRRVGRSSGRAGRPRRGRATSRRRRSRWRRCGRRSAASTSSSRPPATPR